MKMSIQFIVFFIGAISLVYGSTDTAISLKNNTNIIGNTRDTTKHSARLTGARPRQTIMAVVMQNLHEIKNAYNQRLKIKGKPYFGGKLFVKFAIDEFGKVIFCETIQDSLGDSTLVRQCINIVKNWQFDHINKPGDITEVVYPFVFSLPTALDEINSGFNTNIIENKPDTTKHPARLTGARSRQSIINVVMNNLHELKDTYNRRLKIKGKPYFGGKLDLKFAIDEFGKVIFCEALQDGLGDSTLVSQCVFIVKNWQFDKIDRPGDITEVVYPFVFAPPEPVEEINSDFQRKYIWIIIIFGSIAIAMLSFLGRHT